MFSRICLNKDKLEPSKDVFPQAEQYICTFAVVQGLCFTFY